MAKSMNTKHCLGCVNDFYNGKNPYGVKECWSLKNAALTTRYRLHVNTPMDQRSGFVKVDVPQFFTS